jgi:hypothetical protein
MAQKKKQANMAPTIQNRKASHDYHFDEKFVAGIQLLGPEIKSVRLRFVPSNRANYTCETCRSSPTSSRPSSLTTSPCAHASSCSPGAS